MIIVRISLVQTGEFVLYKVQRQLLLKESLFRFTHKTNSRKTQSFTRQPIKAELLRNRVEKKGHEDMTM